MSHQISKPSLSLACCVFGHFENNSFVGGLGFISSDVASGSEEFHLQPLLLNAVFMSELHFLWSGDMKL